MRKFQSRRNRRGFTLVEVLIVVVILGILAATVLPQFTDSNNDAKESAVSQDLKQIRHQIQLYKFHHEGNYPASGSTDAQDFYDALLLASDADGTTGEPGTKPFGPYLIGQIPPNPYNGLSTVMMSTTPISEVTPDDSTGWIYHPATGGFKANTPAATVGADGTPIHEL